MHRERGLVLVGVALCLLCMASAWGQEAAPPPRLLHESFVRDLPAKVGNIVMVKGIAGKITGLQDNTKSYSLTDGLGDVAVVTTDLLPSLGHVYTVVGYALEQGGRVVIAEKHLLVNQTDLGQPEPPIEMDRIDEYMHVQKPGARPPQPLEKQPTKSTDWVLYAAGGGFILLAVILGTVLGVRSSRLKRAEMARLAQEQAEAERQRLAQADSLLGPTGPMPLDETIARPGPAESASAGVLGQTLEAWGSLEVVEGPAAGQHFPLAGRQVVIGRTEGDIRLSSDDAVSRRHGYLQVTNDGRLLYVDDSRNGSIVAGTPVHRAQVEVIDGTEIQMGLSKVVVHLPLPLASRQGDDVGRAPTVAVDIGSMPTEMFTGCEIHVVNGELAGRTFPLSKAQIIIGRAEGADIRLTDRTVSRQHATLVLEHGQFVIQNDSQQGTQVNGERVDRQPLSNGDRIQLGEVTLEFRSVK